MSGDTQIGRGSLLLGFGAGIIRQEAFADYDGFEFADAMVRHACPGQLCPPGTTVKQNCDLWPFFTCLMLNHTTTVHLLGTTTRDVLLGKGSARLLEIP